MLSRILDGATLSASFKEMLDASAHRTTAIADLDGRLRQTTLSADGAEA
ncbi:MAG: hypothetical protein ABI969_02160 [bacterium]